MTKKIIIVCVFMVSCSLFFSIGLNIGYKLTKDSYTTSNNNDVMDSIEHELDVACGSDPYCRDVFVDC